MVPTGPGDYRIALPHGGLDRSYSLHMPPATGRLPLVVMLHGAGGSADFAAEETGWSKLANQVGFIVAYPEGVPIRREKATKFLTNPQEWNDGSGRGRHDDVGFLAAVLDDLADRTDPDRIFLTGFSNGAGMAFRFAAERADRVAGISPVAGHYWVSARPSRTVPTYYLVGDSDPLMPLPGGTARTPWGAVKDRPVVSNTLQRWGEATGLVPGSDSFPVRIIHGHGHHWPGGRVLMGERLGGPATAEINATAEIWDFFRRIL